jgi:hypothetical protein
MDNKISVDEQLGWRMATFAQALDVSRSKAYQVAAEHPEITVRIGGCLRIVPAKARRLIATLAGDVVEAK